MGREDADLSVYANIRSVKVMRLLSIWSAGIAIFLGGCAATTPLPADMSSGPDDVLIARIQRGEIPLFPAYSETDGAPHRSMVCDWVHQGRRDVVAAWLDQNHQAGRDNIVQKVPLLACVSSEADYQHYKRMGATNAAYGGKQWDHDGAPWWITTSLHDAISNANVEAVAAHLADRVDIEGLPRFRTTARLPLEHALEIKHFLMQRSGQSRAGLWPAAGFNPMGEYVRLDPNMLKRMDRILRILIESGAHPTEPAAASGYRISVAQHYRSEPEFARLLSQRERAHELHGSCLYSNDLASCQQLVAITDPLSKKGRDASKQLASLEAEQDLWSKRLARQACSLVETDWIYLSSACRNRLADGKGQAQSRNGKAVFNGTFRAGTFVEGRYSREGKPLYEGPFLNGKAEGVGICWSQGQPEECRMVQWKRVDALQQQRDEQARQREQAERDRREQEEAQERGRRIAAEDARRARDRAAQEASDERRQQRAMSTALGNRSRESGLESTLRFNERMEQIRRQGMADIERARTQQQQSEARKTAQDRNSQTPGQVNTGRQASARTTSPASAATAAPRSTATPMTAAAPPPTTAHVEDDGCLTSVGWCAGSGQLLETASTYTVRVTNNCPHRLYTKICMEMKDGRQSCESHGHTSQQQASASYNRTDASGRFTVRSVGSVQSGKDWVCSAKVSGW